MDINSFQTLDREAQLAEAGRIAGVEPSVFDGIWRTESGRGANMLSPAGAEGHFGLMPKTRKTMEQRLGTSIDPHNFGQALYTSALLMKENLGRFGNVPDALRAYNGGWNPKTWGNTETAAYASKVLGTDEEEGEAELNASTAQALAQGRVVTPAASLWERAAQGPAGRSGPPADLSPVMAALAAAHPEPQAPKEPTYNVYDGIVGGAAKAGIEKHQLAENTSFLDTMRAAAHSTLLNQTLVHLFRDQYPADPNFVPKEEELKGKTESEQTELRAARSRREFDRVLFDQDYEREQHDITFRNGTLFGLGASLLADLPGAAATGGVGSLAFKGAGLGAYELASQGRRIAALTSLAGEGIAGNVAYTAALDALGEHQGLEGYAMAVAGGMLNPLLGGRAVGSAVERHAEGEAAIRIAEQAKTQQVLLLKQAAINLGDKAEGPALAAEMKRLEAEGLRAEIASHTAVVPESRKFNVGDASPEVAANEKAPTGWDKVEGRDLQPLKSPDEANKELGPFTAEPWQQPAYHQARMDAAASNPEWRASIVEHSEGMEWEQVKALPKGVNTSENFKAAAAVNPAFTKAEALVNGIVKEYLPGARILLTTGSKAGAHGGIVSVGNTHIISLNLMRAEHGQVALDHTTLHELGHAIFHQKAPFVAPQVMDAINKDWLEFVNRARAGDTAAFTHRYAATSDKRYMKQTGKDAGSSYDMSRDEYMAEQFVHHIHGRMLRGEYGSMDKTVIDQIMTGVKAVIEYVKGLFRSGFVGKDMGPDRFFTAVLKSVEQGKLKAEAGGFPVPKVAALDSAATADVEAHVTDPIAKKYGLDMMPLGTLAERAEAKQILNVYKRADAWAAANPVDEKRLNKILARFDSFDPVSNQMLRSDNPVVRMVASELLENGGGAAGRRSSAAIAKYMNERAIIGNVINDLDASFQLWHKAQGGDRVGEFLTGRGRAAFNKLVAEEIEQRRYPSGQTDLGDHVRAAADAVEQSFERARLMQIDAKTIGWGSLPETSKGYMPHRMRAEQVRSLTLAQKRALHGALTDQFVEIEGFDMSFADQLASKYLDRVERRALGGFDAPAGIHQTGAPDIVREALEQMGMNRAEVDATMGRYMKGGAGHTKKRLNLDLRQQFTNEDGTTFRLLDLFDTDMLSLVRGQSQRVSGEVALTRHGIMGKPGMAILREAMKYGEAGASKAKLNELEAFDAAAAEFLGAPFGTQNKWVDRAMQANSVASLGGMGFNQLGEIINVGTTLGVKRAFSVIGSVGKMRAEIKALAKGKAVDNPWLNSIEKMGGAEFGTDAYKMVFPMDLPDAPINTMGADSLTAADRLLRGAGHLQSKLSFWRTIHSTQVRGVAEQIVRTFAEALHTGKTDVTLADMGLTADVLARLRADKANILRTQGGRVTGFDITAATDKDAAMQLVQAVHRGASQMIQGTFIGESGKYVHNSYLKMLAQFRSFSLTAIDKQWNRQKANKGVAAALGMTVGAMGAAAPIYMVRTYLASIGREDQEEYLDKHLGFGAIARATTNYIATSGLAGDFLDVLTSVTGTGELTGGRSGTNTTLTGNLVGPVLGKVDKLWGAVQNTKDGTDVHGLVKELPLSRLPMLIPAINALD